MKEMWKKACFFKNDLYLGDMKNPEQFERYYFKNEAVNQAIQDLVDYGSDINCYHSVLVAGDAGSGKSSLINYVIQEKLVNKAYFVLLELDHNTNNSLIIHQLIKGIENYFKVLAEKIDTAGTAYAYYERDIEKKTKEEKLISLLEAHNEISEDEKVRLLPEYINLVIVIDQIDLASISILEKNIKEIFSLLDSSKYTLKIVCARHVTIKICRTRVNSLFATTFRRQIEVFPANIKTILEYRVNDAATSADTSKKLFFGIFSDTVLKFLIVLNCGNIRKTLELIEHIILRTKPDDMNNTVKVLNYLIRENYITRLSDLAYTFGELRLPLYYIVFKTLFYYKKCDTKLVKLISRSIEKSGIDTRYASAITLTSLKESVKYLMEQNLIMESDYQKNQIDITRKGIFIDDITKNKDIPFLTFNSTSKSFSRYKVDESTIVDF